MAGLSAIVSVFALYTETILQSYVLARYTREGTLNPALLYGIISLLGASFVLTNAASAFIIFSKSSVLGNKTATKLLCIIFHVVQLGLVWRVARVILHYDVRNWFDLTGLRLVHLSLQSIPYIIIHGRLAVERGSNVDLISLASLIISLASASLALCLYVIRHQTDEAVWMEALFMRTNKVRRSWGVTLFFIGTLLCLATRLTAFILLSVEHGAWMVLPLSIHLMFFIIVYFACCHNTKMEAKTACLAFVLRGLALSYLNVFELVEDKIQRIQCRYVFYYSSLFVENVAMVALWLIFSTLDYTTKLLVVVGMLVAFLAALFLKFASCGFQNKHGVEGNAVSNAPDLATIFLQSRPESGTSGASSGGRYGCTGRIPDGSSAGSKQSMSVVTVSSLSGEGFSQHNLHRHCYHQSHSADCSKNDFASITTSTLLSGSISVDVPNQVSTQVGFYKREHPKTKRRRRKTHMTKTPRHEGLLGEACQEHLKDLIQDIIRHGSLTLSDGSANMSVDRCSFDDPVSASNIITSSPRRHMLQNSKKASWLTGSNSTAIKQDSSGENGVNENGLVRNRHHRKDQNQPRCQEKSSNSSLQNSFQNSLKDNPKSASKTSPLTSKTHSLTSSARIRSEPNLKGKIASIKPDLSKSRSTIAIRDRILSPPAEFHQEDTESWTSDSELSQVCQSFSETDSVCTESQHKWRSYHADMVAEDRAATWPSRQKYFINNPKRPRLPRENVSSLETVRLWLENSCEDNVSGGDALVEACEGKDATMSRRTQVHRSGKSPPRIPTQNGSEHVNSAFTKVRNPAATATSEKESTNPLVPRKISHVTKSKDTSEGKTDLKPRKTPDSSSCKMPKPRHETHKSAVAIPAQTGSSHSSCTRLDSHEVLRKGECVPGDSSRSLLPPGPKWLNDPATEHRYSGPKLQPTHQTSSPKVLERSIAHTTQQSTGYQGSRDSVTHTTQQSTGYQGSRNSVTHTTQQSTGHQGSRDNVTHTTQQSTGHQGSRDSVTHTTQQSTGHQGSRDSVTHTTQQSTGHQGSRDSVTHTTQKYSSQERSVANTEHLAISFTDPKGSRGDIMPTTHNYLKLDADESLV